MQRLQLIKYTRLSEEQDWFCRTFLCSPVFVKSVKVGSQDPIFPSNYSSAHFLRQQLDV